MVKKIIEACRSGNYNKLKLLIEKGHDVNTKDELVNIHIHTHICLHFQ